MSAHYPIAAITDEFSPDIERAVRSMSEVGMTGAELRMVFGKNIVDLTDEELDRAIAIVRGQGLEIISIASPLLKCVLPDAPEVDARFQQDMFAAKHHFEDQPRLTARAFEIAARTGARIIRVFSYWRTVRPEECFDRVVAALRGLAEQAAGHGTIIGIENEHACNIGTGEETARVLAACDHPNLKVVWDPANALVAGETPFPRGYHQIPPGRIVHVHAKDCFVTDHKPTFGPLGECAVDWKGQIAALVEDGYKGWISLETHWPGPGGDKHEASMICGRNLKRLVSAA
jgi:sugar phosphate isomerase/epimerase